MEALKCNATQGLTPLISDPDVGVRLAGIKAVTVVAEAAQGRQAFQALLPTVRMLKLCVFQQWLPLNPCTNLPFSTAGGCGQNRRRAC